MGHGPPYEVPDYKIYNVDGCKKLEKLQAALEAKGLKDPWIRNEVWRYNKGFPTMTKNIFGFFFRGFPIGVGLTAITVFGVKMLGGGGGHHEEHEAHSEDKH